MPAVYNDGIQSVRRSVSGRFLPSAREVSDVVHEDRDVPLASVTHMLMQWGQFVDHDITGECKIINKLKKRQCLLQCEIIYGVSTRSWGGERCALYADSRSYYSSCLLSPLCSIVCACGISNWTKSCFQRNCSSVLRRWWSWVSTTWIHGTLSIYNFFIYICIIENNKRRNWLCIEVQFVKLHDNSIPTVYQLPLDVPIRISVALGWDA